MTNTGTVHRPGRLLVTLMAGGAFVTGVVVLVVSSNAPSSGGIDRALVGWLVVVPLVLAGPAIAGVGAAVIGDRRFTAALIGGLAVLCGAVVGYWLFTATQQFACAPVVDQSVLLVPSIVVAATAAFVLLAAAATSYLIMRSGSGRPGRLVAALLAGGAMGLAGSFLTILVWISLFPVLSCAAPSV